MTWAKLGLCIAHFSCGETHGNLSIWSWINTTSTGCVSSAIFAGFLRLSEVKAPGFQALHSGVPALWNPWNLPESSQVKSSLPMEAKVASWLKNRMYRCHGRTPRKKRTATGKGGGFTAGAKGKGGLDGLNVAPCAPCSSLDASESILCRVLVQKQWAT